jgi:hypothetical protein
MAQQPGLNAILEYRSVVDYNRTIFLLNHAWALNVFSTIDTGFTRLSELLRRPSKSASHF